MKLVVLVDRALIDGKSLGQFVFERHEKFGRCLSFRTLGEYGRLWRVREPIIKSWLSKPI